MIPLMDQPVLAARALDPKAEFPAVRPVAVPHEAKAALEQRRFLPAPAAGSRHVIRLSPHQIIFAERPDNFKPAGPGLRGTTPASGAGRLPGCSARGSSPCPRRPGA